MMRPCRHVVGCGGCGCGGCGDATGDALAVEVALMLAVLQCKILVALVMPHRSAVVHGWMDGGTGWETRCGLQLPPHSPVEPKCHLPQQAGL